jgi:hypothetical protein
VPRLLSAVFVSMPAASLAFATVTCQLKRCNDPSRTARAPSSTPAPPARLDAGVEPRRRAAERGPPWPLVRGPARGERGRVEGRARAAWAEQSVVHWLIKR